MAYSKYVSLAQAYSKSTFPRFSSRSKCVSTAQVQPKSTFACGRALLRSTFRPRRRSPNALRRWLGDLLEVRFDCTGAVQVHFFVHSKLRSWVEVRFDRTGAAQIIFFALSRFPLKCVSSAQAQSKLTFPNFSLFGSKYVSTAQALPKPTFRRSRLWRFEASNLRGPLD